MARTIGGKDGIVRDYDAVERLIQRYADDVAEQLARLRAEHEEAMPMGGHTQECDELDGRIERWEYTEKQLRHVQNTEGWV